MFLYHAQALNCTSRACESREIQIHVCVEKNLNKFTPMRYVETGRQSHNLLDLYQVFVVGAMVTNDPNNMGTLSARLELLQIDCDDSTGSLTSSPRNLKVEEEDSEVRWIMRHQQSERTQADDSLEVFTVEQEATDPDADVDMQQQEISCEPSSVMMTSNTPLTNGFALAGSSVPKAWRPKEYTEDIKVGDHDADMDVEMEMEQPREHNQTAKTSDYCTDTSVEATLKAHGVTRAGLSQELNVNSALKDLDDLRTKCAGLQYRAKMLALRLEVSRNRNELGSTDLRGNEPPSKISYAGALRSNLCQPPHPATTVVRNQRNNQCRLPPPSTRRQAQDSRASVCKHKETQMNGLNALASVVDQLIDQELPWRLRAKNTTSSTIATTTAKTMGSSPTVCSTPSIALSQSQVPALTPLPSVNDVCIVLDVSSAMIKFQTPLHSNFKVFWSLVSAASDRKLRMSILTPSNMLDFTSDEAEFKAFAYAINTNVTGAKEGGFGLGRAMARLRKIKWEPKSTRHVYIFTNLAAWNEEKEPSVKEEVVVQACHSMRHLPRGAKVMAGCWMNNNDVLVEALIRNAVDFNRFAFLDVKAMAMGVVEDKGLLKGLYHSSVTWKKKTRVRLGEKPLGPSTRAQRLSEDQYRSKVVKARMTLPTPIKSVQEIHAVDQTKWTQQDCWVETEAGPFRMMSSDRVYRFAKMGHIPGEWKNAVVLKSYKVDLTCGGVQVELSERRCKNQLFVSEVARFLAARFNEEHRPGHCRKIHFLKGGMVQQASDGNSQQVFYAERRCQVAGPEVEFMEYCSAAGEWNESCVDESLLRFTQACFKLTGGEVMLAGLKGVRHGDCYRLTVPALLCRTFCGEHTNECTKEYMKQFRLQTKALMKENGWDQKVHAAKEISKKPPRCFPYWG